MALRIVKHVERKQETGSTRGASATFILKTTGASTVFVLNTTEQCSWRGRAPDLFGRGRRDRRGGHELSSIAVAQAQPTFKIGRDPALVYVTCIAGRQLLKTCYLLDASLEQGAARQSALLEAWYRREKTGFPLPCLQGKTSDGELIGVLDLDSRHLRPYARVAVNCLRHAIRWYGISTCDVTPCGREHYHAGTAMHNEVDTEQERPMKHGDGQ